MTRTGRPRSFEEVLLEALEGSAAEPVSRGAIDRLQALDRWLVRWAARIDLHGFGSDEERVRRYFAEPLAAVRWAPVEGAAVDVGSGGGSPALPIAVMRPTLRYRLLEPRRKKALFLEEAARAIGLSRVEVIAARLEDAGNGEVDLVTLRGVRVTEALARKVAGSLRPGGRFLWFSGEARLDSEARPRGLDPLHILSGPTPVLARGSSRLLVMERPA